MSPRSDVEEIIARCRICGYQSVEIPVGSRQSRLHCGALRRPGATAQLNLYAAL